VANKQTLCQVQTSKIWWFDNSSPGHERGSVDTVLIAKVFNDDVGTIMVELWFRGKRGPRMATIRLKDGGRSPARGARGNPDLWTWSGVPLRIPFEDILLRPKQGLERDFEVTGGMLVEMATLAWGWREYTGRGATSATGTASALRTRGRKRKGSKSVYRHPNRG